MQVTPIPSCTYHCHAKEIPTENNYKKKNHSDKELVFFHTSFIFFPGLLPASVKIFGENSAPPALRVGAIQ